MAIEEAYELVEAIDEGRDEDLVGELGDLLLQVVFHAQIGAEEGRFTAADVSDRVREKMVRRHPHVFGDDGASTSGEVLRNWEALKAQERQARGTADGSMLDSVSKAHPAVMEAFQITTKAARVGFDWKDAADRPREARGGDGRAAGGPGRRRRGAFAATGGWPRRSATCSSWPSTWRARPGSIRRARSRRRTGSSGAASGTSRTA